MTVLKSKRFWIIIAVGILGAGFSAWHVSSKSTPRQVLSTNSSVVITHPSDQPTMTTPSILHIPKLGIQAKIEATGLNTQGNMGAPRSPAVVAWFKNGPVPGSRGNAVIAGHFGRPHQAAFWNLSSLQVGDKIEVIDAARTLARFKVTGTQRAVPDLATRDHIFGNTNGSHLNLITCDGTWDEASKSYDERLIVFTSLETISEQSAR